MKLKLTALLVFLTMILGCDRTTDGSQDWYVLEVVDGDTLVVEHANGSQDRIRLCGIDAPEDDQPLGDEATALLADLVEGRFIALVPVERDRFDRLVAEVFVEATPGTDEEERFAQEELLLSGLAWVYPQYVGGCPNGEPMQTAEEIARTQQAGIWSDPASVPPWEWRRR